MTPEAQYRQSQRMICALAGLDYRKVKSNDMTGRERGAYNLASLLIGDGTFVCTNSGDVAVLHILRARWIATGLRGGVGASGGTVQGGSQEGLTWLWIKRRKTPERVPQVRGDGKRSKSSRHTPVSCLLRSRN